MKSFFDLDNRMRRNVLVQTDHGMMIVNRFDRNHEQVGQGQWLLDHGSVASVEAYDCIQAIHHLTSPVIFDIGANIGNWCTWMAKYFPQGHIWAIEPQRSVFQILTGNMAINNYHNVTTLNCAMSDKNQVMTFMEPDYFQCNDYGIFSLVEQKISNLTAHQHAVEIYQLDYFLQRFSIADPDLVKIDAEGMDLQVLQGAKNLLHRSHPVIYVEHCDNQISIENQLRDFLGAFGYEFFVNGNNLLATVKS